MMEKSALLSNGFAKTKMDTPDNPEDDGKKY